MQETASELGQKGRDFVGYEYLDIHVSQKMESFYVDGYTNFGWSLENISKHIHPDSVTLKFRRDRKIRNKAELTRLQRKFDAIIEEIESLERSKGFMASVVAYVIGVLGTACMAGSVFAMTNGLTPLSVVLAVPGFIGWVAPYLVYRRMKQKKTIQVLPQIDEKYDEVYSVTKNANSLLPE